MIKNELADWLLSEQARFASSMCCNDPAVKGHIEFLKRSEAFVRSATPSPSAEPVALPPSDRHILMDLKAAFDGRNVARKNIALRRAYDALYRSDLRLPPVSDARGRLTEWFDNLDWEGLSDEAVRHAEHAKMLAALSPSFNKTGSGK